MNKLLTQEMVDDIVKENSSLIQVRDGDSGLMLWLYRSTGAYWHFDTIEEHLLRDGYEGDGEPGIGKYPEMSLSQARTAYKEYLEKILKEVAEKLAYENTKG